MPKDSTKAASNIFLDAEWYESIETRVRTEIRRVHRVDIGGRAVDGA
jgi:hypothetical protein